ncbi:MAG: hypothetical protein AAF589_06105, partial [Planctomycetota bacterium]
MKQTLLRIALVLAAAAVIVAVTQYAARRYMARGLGDRVVADGAAAMAYAPELARFDADGLEGLANAAANADVTIATVARRQIDVLLNRWNGLEATRLDFDATDRRLELARRLKANAARYTPSGRTWLGKAAERIVAGESDAGQEVLPLIALADELIDISRQRSDVVDLMPA